MAMPNCSPPPGGGFLLLRWAGGGLGWFWNESEEEGLWAHLAAAQSPTPLPLRSSFPPSDLVPAVLVIDSLDPVLSPNPDMPDEVW